MVFHAGGNPCDTIKQGQKTAVRRVQDVGRHSPKNPTPRKDGEKVRKHYVERKIE